MITMRIPDGIIHFSESKADCVYCQRNAPFEEFEKKWDKSSDGFIKHRCKGCRKYFGITQDITGDFVSYELGREEGKLL